jgi:GNAT superfamily N-acetyltransferase
MRIVRAQLQDVPRIMECARQFTAILPDCTLDEAHYGNLWRRVIEAGAGAIFLLETDEGGVAGGIGGICTPDILTGQLVAVELFWYVQPEHRHGLFPVRLLREYERWASGQGCVHVSMIYMEASMPERMKEFYERSGYRLLETVYRKRLKGAITP